MPAPAARLGVAVIGGVRVGVQVALPTAHGAGGGTVVGVRVAPTMISRASRRHHRVAALRGGCRSVRPFDRGSGSCYNPDEGRRRDTMGRKDKGGKKVKKPKQDKAKKGPSGK